MVQVRTEYRGHPQYSLVHATPCLFTDDASPLRTVQYGLLVSECHELGLYDIIQYTDGVPSCVHYEKIGVMLLPIIRQYRDEIRTMKERILLLEKTSREVEVDTKSCFGCPLGR
jgi:hypothetical protein